MIWHEDRKPCAPCLIDEDEAARINRGLVVDPILPPLHDVRTVLLAGMRGGPRHRRQGRDRHRRRKGDPRHWPHMIHAWLLFYQQLTEGRQALAEAGAFIRAKLA